ncbi:MAG: lipocalin family protein [Bacteroidota bacterium]
MKNSFSFIGIVLLMLSMSACSDPDAATQLTDGIWNFRNMTTDSEDETITGMIALGKALLTDATMEFQSDKTYMMDSPLLAEPETGTWSLIGEDQLILTPDDGYPSTANIEELTKDKLTYIETYVNQEMNTYSVTTTWARK